MTLVSREMFSSDVQDSGLLKEAVHEVTDHWKQGQGRQRPFRDWMTFELPFRGGFVYIVCSRFIVSFEKQSIKWQ